MVLMFILVVPLVIIFSSNHCRAPDVLVYMREAEKLFQNICLVVEADKYSY